MGIHDRDYMSRPSDSDGDESSPSDKAEVFLRDFLEKHPKFLRTAGIVFCGLIALALIAVALVSTKP